MKHKYVFIINIDKRFLKEEEAQQLSCNAHPQQQAKAVTQLLMTENRLSSLSKLNLMRHKENMISVKQHSSGKSKSYEPMKKKKKKAM